MKGVDILKQDIIDLINRKENQILVHSCIYYRLSDNIIPDWKYDSFGADLIRLAKEYPDEFKASYHYNDFIEYVNSDTPSGFDLPYTTCEVISRATHLVSSQKIKRED